MMSFLFFFSSRRRHTRLQGDWSSDVCSSDLLHPLGDEVDPLQEVELRGLSEGGGDAASGGQEPERARCLEKAPTGDRGHVPPPRFVRRSVGRTQGAENLRRSSGIVKPLSGIFDARAAARGGGAWDH